MRLVTSFLMFSLFLTGCNSFSAVRVAYLVLPGGQLSSTELAKHPEILVTSNFNEFKQAASHRIALWIDKNATQLIEEGWLDKMPQASYPIVVVGYNDTIRSFRDSLNLCCFAGPVNLDYSGSEPGFSVIERTNGEPPTIVIMGQGFKEVPTVDAILKISNDLLDGKVNPTSTPQPMLIFPAVTPTP